MPGKLKHSRVHLILFYVWLVLAIPTALWWRDILFWTQIMSLYAILVTHHGSYEASSAKESAQRTEAGQGSR